jgi:YHS domain-containing protein
MTATRTVLLRLAATFALVCSPLGSAADAARVVLKGYDPVAYFTEGKPVKGDPRYAYDWDEGRYHFASAKHRDMFAGNPEKYAPQFGGYCTGSMSRGVRNEADPEGWTIQDGQLYMFGAAKWKATAEADPQFIPTRLDAARKHYRAGK